MRDSHIDGLKYSIRGKIFDEDMIVDVKDFEITDEKNNKFITDYKDLELCVDDFQYLIVYGKVFKDIIKRLCEEQYYKGLEDGKSSKTKKKEIISNEDNQIG